MNAERLKQLTERADKAKKAAEEIACLEAATPGYRTGLTRLLEAEAFELGRKKLIEQKEAQLSELLGESQTPAVSSGDVSIGTLDSSDTWEQP